MPKKSNKLTDETVARAVEKFRIKKPKEIYEYLNKFVIGQDEAKKTLAVAVYDHYLSNKANLDDATPGIEGDGIYEENKDVVIEKSNIMVLGNTGTGKTYMLKQIAKYLDIPCYIADTTKLTQAGYVGDDVENIILGLLMEADMDIEQAERGIIVLDEIDKIGRKSDNPSITRDVGGEGVQQSLLKIVEGGAVRVPPNGGRKHPEQGCLLIDTTNILFVGLGAFDGLDKIVERRLNKRTVGFNNKQDSDGTDDRNILSYVTPSDLKSFGLIPELIGRFPVITYTDDLTKEDLVRIIKEPNNSLLKQKRKLLLISGVDVNFTDDAIELIAETALTTKTGARGLRNIMEFVLRDISFEYADKYGEHIMIDRKYVGELLDRRHMVRA